MAIALLIVVVAETYRLAVRTYHRRQAKKYAYDNLPHDALRRPVGNDGKTLSRNEARALAQYRRENEQRKREAERRFVEGNTLPDYSSVQQIDKRERQSWLANEESRATTTTTTTTSSSERPSNGSTDAGIADNLNNTSSSPSSPPHTAMSAMSWSGSPPYPIDESLDDDPHSHHVRPLPLAL